MLKIKYSKRFKKDLKKFQHQKSTMAAIREVIEKLLAQVALEEKYCDHSLSGNWSGHRDCHVKPDVVLIYRSCGDTLFLERIGSHSELFK